LQLRTNGDEGAMRLSRIARSLAGVALFLVLVGLIRWQQTRTQPHHVVAGAARPLPSLSSVSSDPTVAGVFETGLEHLPASLEGADPPVGLIIDGAGNLVVRRSLRDFFDFFLSALGKESLATLRARIQAYMAKSLPKKAYPQAESILDGYLGYRLALQSVVKAGGKPAAHLDLGAVASQKMQERALRAQFLPAHVSAAFFDDDDRYDNYTLSRRLVETDDALSDAEKNSRVAELFAQLPPATQASIRSLQALHDVERVTTECVQRGCTKQELHQQRAAVVGEAAADRLQALDEQRASWASRVEAYVAQRAAILSDRSLTDAGKATQLNQLMQRDFNAHEQLRLPAFGVGQDHLPEP